MGDSIPDEILSEILSPALRVSDAAFAATFETVSPFLSTSESSSAFLLVSKSFLRVATPLLYNVVVLRSKAQAQALAGVLTSNPALGKFIRKLRLETVVELHYRIVPLRMSYMTWGGMSEIARALSRAPNLATLVVSNQESFLTSIRLISPNPALKRIRIKSFDSLSEAERRRYIRAVKQLSNRMYELFDFPDEWPSSDDAPPPFVYPPRLAADALAPRRLSLLLVSKKFARLGIPHVYASPTLFQDLQLRSFAVRLSQHPLLGRHVRRITISHRDDSDVNLLRTIIAHTPFLVGFFGGSRCSPIPWLTFDQLGYSRRLDPLVMRYFGWNSPIVFKTGAKWIPRHTFNNLVRLTVATFDPSFLEVLSRMELPSLRTASFSATADGGLPFFLKHGKKLEHLTVSVHQIADPDLAIFQSCPSISVLGISCDEKTILSTDGFNPPDKHMCLERIVFMAY
ncbi:F-box domain-containing protein [Mycena venus]|uniref:F-box domain-containing protein n=1 Tax=Mycena venus TaxID=2733690 RepID=A0A8H6YQM9_9AGAR|nr:F-box domain-containing protein [Mycena venus]